MGLKGHLKRLARSAEREMIVFELGDGSTGRFHEDEFLDCFVHEWARGRCHYFGEEPGAPHQIIKFLRKASDEDLLRIKKEHGLFLIHLVGEDRIIQGRMERR